MIIDALNMHEDRPGLAGLPRMHWINGPVLEYPLHASHHAACRAALDAGQPLMIDSERKRLNINVETDAEVEEEMDKLIAWMGLIRASYPGLRLSVWNRPEAGHPRVHLQEDWPAMAARLGKSRDENGQFNGSGLIDKMDYFTPSRYMPADWLTYSRRLEVWKLATDHIVKWCRARGKPCFLFVSQQPNGELDQQNFYSDADMIEMVTYGNTKTDGVYLWGDYTRTESGDPSWLEGVLSQQQAGER